MSDDALAQALLHADAVALVGASADPAKNTGRPQRFLKAHGYTGRVVPINPNRDEVQGAPAYARIADAPPGVQHAFVMVPAPRVPDVIADCVAAGVKVATIYSDGFAEAGPEGAALQDRVLAIAREGGVRIIGPNSMGVIDTRSHLTLTINAFLEVPELKTGRIGVVSQSGTVIGTMLSRGAARGVGFASLVSIGNESDIGVGELVDAMVADLGIDTILLFLEAIRDAERLAAAARRAYDAGKPVIAYKLGRSEVGRELAVSHSGAIAGPDASVDAFFRHHGIVRVDMLETLLELPPLLAGTPPKPGNRVAVVTTTGGGSAMVVDRLGAAGLKLVGPSNRLRDRMAEFNLDLGRRRVIDLTMAGTGPGVYGAALDVLLHEPDLDAVVAVVGTSAQFHPEVAVKPIVEAPRTAPPLAAFLVPQADKSLALLMDAGIAAFRTPEACADGVRALLDRHAPAPVVAAEADAVAPLLAGKAGTVLSEADAAQVFRAVGVPMAAAVVLDGPDAAIPDDLTYPVAAKVLSADLPHKTEAGAVALDIADAEALRAAAARIWAAAKSHAPDAVLDGIIVQPMVDGLAEVLVGFRRDAETGPMVIVGPGGVLAELYGDAAVRPAPIDRATAEAMIAEVRGLAPIRGYRNLPKGDVGTLADVLVAVSRLAALDAPAILEAEINPLCVKAAGSGVVAVDALVRTAP
ncbi:MAG: acetate--CoA ligase family protein [Rhodospirillaceae bacterium]